MEVVKKEARLVKPVGHHSNSISTTEIPLSICDLAMPNIYAMAIYAFKAPTPKNASHELERGLAMALDEYPEWAGRLSKDTIQLTHDGVSFVEATADIELEDLMPFNPSPLDFHFVPSTQGVPHLLLIQLTRLRCGGIVLGVTWHHRLADGEAFFTFMDNWARITRGLPILHVPHHDRSALMPRNKPQPLTDDYKLLAPPLPPPPPLPILSVTSDSSSCITSSIKQRPTLAQKFHFSLQELQRIKKKAAMGTEEENNDVESNSNTSSSTSKSNAATTFESLTAHMWRCMTKARELQGQVQTKITIPLNGRMRLDPPIPEHYFGNMTFGPSSVAIEASTLLTKPLSFATQLVQNAVKKADDKYLRSAVDLMEVQSRYMMMEEAEIPRVMAPDVLVTSWVRFPLYKVDFGWGKPCFVGNVIDVFEGIIVLLPSYTMDESIDAVVALFEPEMLRMQQLCYTDF